MPPCGAEPCSSSAPCIDLSRRRSSCTPCLGRALALRDLAVRLMQRWFLDRKPTSWLKKCPVVSSLLYYHWVVFAPADPTTNSAPYNSKNRLNSGAPTRSDMNRSTPYSIANIAITKSEKDSALASWILVNQLRRSFLFSPSIVRVILIFFENVVPREIVATGKPAKIVLQFTSGRVKVINLLASTSVGG